MANKINFITGETYTLAELFSGGRRIIIPDLQRDYCWGNEDNKKGTGEKGELVTDFINNLLDQFKEYQIKKDKGNLNLGLFYGYEVPTDHIQLCDGQQRLTTLYLLLGMINKNTEKFRCSLISDFEYKHDDKEPYLNYAIRESSLYFLSDLVCKFFINNNDNVDKIKSADWYFDDYNLDPSIQSILKALAKIEKILEENQSLDLSELGDWLLNKVTFLYFDMENRTNGEETFVVINTTGEPLSSTQNLKPLIIQEKKNISFTINAGEEYKSVDKCWEEIETWFWKNRDKNNNDTAEAGFAEFLRWISIIEQVEDAAPAEENTESVKKLIQLILQGKHCDFPYRKIKFKTIYNYWKALRWIAQNNDLSFVENYLSPSVNKDVNNRSAIGQNDCFVLLPVLKFVYQNITDIDTDNEKQRNTRRIYEFFKNLIRINNVSKAVNTLVGDALKIIDLLQNGELVSLINVDTSNISKQILTNEEKSKLKILSKSNDRENVEIAFWSAQEHPIWSGEILPMIEWATDSEGIFQLSKFNEYKDKFKEIFAGKCDSNIDTVRRALLTRKLNRYPRVFKGNTNISFGWDWNDWHVLINDNKDEFKSFFDELLQGSNLETMIQYYINSNNNYASSTNPFYLFVLHPELLQYCEQKNIQKWDNSYCLVPRYRATKYLEMKTFCLYLDLFSISNSVVTNKPIALHKDDGVNYRDWKMWLWQEGTSALVLDRNWNNLQVAIDVRYRRTKDDDWNVQLFLRKGDTQGILNQIASQCGLIWNESRYELNDLSRQGAIDNINDILKKIE